MLELCSFYCTYMCVFFLESCLFSHWFKSNFFLYHAPVCFMLWQFLDTFFNLTDSSSFYLCFQDASCLLIIGLCSWSFPFSDSWLNIISPKFDYIASVTSFRKSSWATTHVTFFLSFFKIHFSRCCFYYVIQFTCMYCVNSWLLCLFPFELIYQWKQIPGFSFCFACFFCLPFDLQYLPWSLAHNKHSIRLCWMKMNGEHASQV